MEKVRELYPKKQKPIFRDQLVTLSDLEAFKTELLLAIKRLIEENKAGVGKKWMKTYEVKALLKVSNGTLQTLRNNGTLPFTKIGSIIYYNSEDIDRLMLEKQKNSSHHFIVRNQYG